MHALGRTAALATTVLQAAAQRERDALLLERIELAREVHESVMQRLFGVSMVLGSGRELSAEDAERSAAEVEAALGELRDALDRSLEPTSEPSRTTLRAELQRLGRQYKAVPLSVRWEPGVDVPEGLEPLAVSVLGEALRNAEKHARPTDVRVAITSLDGAFALEVRNDGVAAPAGPAAGPRACGSRPTSRCSAAACSSSARRADEWRVRLVLPASDVAGFVGGGGAMTERPLRVLIVDDHAVVQWGFKVLLGRQKWVERCIVASDPDEALERAERHKPACRARRPVPRRALRAPSCARRSARVSPADARPADLRRRLDLAAGGAHRRRLGLRLQGLERRRGRDGGADGRQGDDRLRPPGGGADAPLSEREREVLALIASGATNREIAERLYLSPHTVKEHASSLYRKLGVKNRAEAARRAERLGLTR